MDYNLGSILSFKCIFCYDFISMFFIGTQYIIYGKIYMDWKKLQQNFNRQITMDFWMTKFGPYFQKSQYGHFLLDWYNSPPNMYVKEFSRWEAFHMDFINWLNCHVKPTQHWFSTFFFPSLALKYGLLGLGLLPLSNRPNLHLPYKKKLVPPSQIHEHKSKARLLSEPLNYCIGNYFCPLSNSQTRTLC